MSRQQMTDEQQRQEEEAMESKAAICKAMAQAFPKIGSAIKGHVNPGFKGAKYADLAAVIDVIKPALTEHGLWFAQITHPSDKGVTVETMLFHESGESLSMGQLFMPASKTDAQGFGSALSYAKRYSLMSAFGVPAEDDDGNAAVRSKPEVVALPAPESLVEAAKNAAMEGTEDFRKYWAKLSKEAREQLRSHLPALQKAAEAADKVPA